VTVALTGDGGDESFCGYDKLRIIACAELYRKYMPALLANKIFPSIANLLIYHRGHRGVAGKMKTLTEYGANTFAKSLELGCIFGDAHKEKLYTSGFKSQLASHAPLNIFEKYGKRADGLNDIDKFLYVDIKTSLPNDYLTKVDVATMMTSLEARCPFLDYELMEFAAKIPSTLKMKDGVHKYLLKKVANKYLPSSAIYRKKWGFGIPIGAWFRNDFNKLLNEILLSDTATGRGYFERNYIKKLLHEHQNRTYDHTHRLWSLLCLELWHQMFIDKTITRNTSLL
jgi:asparagine synthase (glutamine-hydrolysing)